MQARAAVQVSFGAVTVDVTPPSEEVRQANIKAGQAALKRGKAALMKAGVKLQREKGTPLYFGCGDRPGWMIRELNGEKTVGRFLNGRFVPERKASAREQAKARAAKA